MAPKKLRGFVAWHEDWGYEIEIRAYSAPVPEETVRIWTSKKIAEVHSVSIRSKSDGWRIREVELRFVDEEEEKK